MDRHTALGKEGILSLIIRFSIPSVVGFTVNAIYNIIDRIFVGRGVGSDALSGVAVAMPFMLTITAFSLFISVGMAVRISIKIGEGKTEEAERIIGNGFILGIIAGLILTAVCTIFMRPILIAFGGKGVSLEYAGKFMDIMVFSIVFQMISYTLSSSIRAEGNPNISLAIMVAGAVINTILNPIFIFVLRLGIAGSALATVISLFAGAVWGILYFTGKNNIIRLRIKNLRPDPKIIFSILSAGSGVFFFHCTQSIMIIVSNNIFSRYGGNDAIAVFGIVCVVNNLFIEVVAGISDGIQPIIGYNYGAGNSGRVKATLLRSIIISSVFCLMGFIPLFFFSRDIISMFSRDNSSIRELGTWGLKYS
ncbi:MAG: MATE family efflux transporter, partial [Brevinematales bacterium]